MQGKSLVQIFQEDDLGLIGKELEIIEMYQNGKLRKFEVLSRQWNEEKVDIDLILRNIVPPRNWVTKSREYKAFEPVRGKIIFV